MNTIIECVKSVPDPRRGNHRKHELCDMLFASLASVLCGYDSYVAFARFADLNLEWMRGLGFAFGNGVPSHDAFRYAFSVVDRGLLSACLRDVSGILRDKAGKGSVSIDGKALGRYYLLAVPLMLCSAAAVSLIDSLLGVTAPGLSTLVKVCVDTVLFLASYLLQKKWVFAKKEKQPPATQEKME